MKKLRTKLFTIAVLLCCISANAYDFEADGLYYNILSMDELTVEVTYKSERSTFYSDESIIIPQTVVYNGTSFTVTRIGIWAFYSVLGNDSIKSVTIPNTVESVEQEAFWSCRNLTNINIPNSVTNIGDGAFLGCNKLPKENGVYYADSWAVDIDRGKNESYSLRSNTTGLADRLFYLFDCSSVEIPNSVKYIGNGTFEECTGLTNITIPNSVISIGHSAFEGCIGLADISIPNSVTSIGQRAFYGCTGLTNITIPNSVTSIGQNAFNCAFLTKVTIESPRIARTT